jgi:hypothetical protein
MSSRPQLRMLTRSLWERASREAGDTVDGTCCAGVRGHARSHRVINSVKKTGHAIAGMPPFSYS